MRILKGAYFMPRYVRNGKRITDKYTFHSEEDRDNAFFTVTSLFPNVSFTKISRTEILFTKTGSIDYDCRVDNRFMKLGAVKVNN